MELFLKRCYNLIKKETNLAYSIGCRPIVAFLNLAYSIGCRLIGGVFVKRHYRSIVAVN